MRNVTHYVKDLETSSSITVDPTVGCTVLGKYGIVEAVKSRNMRFRYLQ